MIQLQIDFNIKNLAIKNKHKDKFKIKDKIPNKIKDKIKDKFKIKHNLNRQHKIKEHNNHNKCKM